MTRVINGKAVAQQVRDEVAAGVRAFAAAYGHSPGLATVLLGDDPGQLSTSPPSRRPPRRSA